MKKSTLYLLHQVKHVPSSIMKTQPAKALSPLFKQNRLLAKSIQLLGEKKTTKKKNVCVFVRGGGAGDKQKLKGFSTGRITLKEEDSESRACS